MSSTKDTPLATSQGDDLKSEPDSKSKDGSIDPPLNRGDETHSKENPHDNSQSEHGSDQVSETNPKIFAHQSAHGPSVQRVANCLGLSPKMCVV